jgi:hypothetical protein
MAGRLGSPRSPTAVAMTGAQRLPVEVLPVGGPHRVDAATPKAVLGEAGSGGRLPACEPGRRDAAWTGLGDRLYAVLPPRAAWPTPGPTRTSPSPEPAAAPAATPGVGVFS